MDADSRIKIMEAALRKVAKMEGLPVEQEWDAFIRCVTDHYDSGLRHTDIARPMVERVIEKPKWDADEMQRVLHWLAKGHFEILLSDLRNRDEQFQDHMKCDGPKSKTLRFPE